MAVHGGFTWQSGSGSAPACPEVECKLGIPRESMSLFGDPAAPPLITTKSGVDHTERTFIFRRWKDLEQADGSIKGLVRFHTDHKLLIMSHDPRSVSALGASVASAKGKERRAVLESYFAGLMRALALEATAKKNVNTLQHAMGYFKKQLSADEKAELLEVIGDYHQGHVPLVVPLVLLRHHVRRFAEPYLARQVWLHPHPVELALRNHV
jgi:uncharacterized protein YbgA (DUF1722 family)